MLRSSSGVRSGGVRERVENRIAKQKRQKIDLKWGDRHGKTYRQTLNLLHQVLVYVPNKFDFVYCIYPAAFRDSISSWKII